MRNKKMLSRYTDYVCLLSFNWRPYSLAETDMCCKLVFQFTYTVHEQYAFLPSDLPNYAFRAGRLAFHGGKTRLWSVGLHIKSGILCMYMYFLLDF